MGKFRRRQEIGEKKIVEGKDRRMARR